MSKEKGGKSAAAPAAPKKSFGSATDYAHDSKSKVNPDGGKKNPHGPIGR